MEAVKVIQAMANQEAKRKPRRVPPFAGGLDGGFTGLGGVAATAVAAPVGGAPATIALVAADVPDDSGVSLALGLASDITSFAPVSLIPGTELLRYVLVGGKGMSTIVHVLVIRGSHLESKASANAFCGCALAENRPPTSRCSQE